MEVDSRDLQEVADADSSVRVLRERVLGWALDVLAIAVPALSVILIGQAIYRGALNTIVLVNTAFTLAFPLLRIFSRRLRFLSKAILVVSLLVFLVFMLAVRGGVGIGSVMLAVMALVLSTLLFGRRGAALVFLLLFLCLLLAGYLLLEGVVPPPEPVTWDQLQLPFWSRQLVSFVVLGIGFLITQVYMIEQLLALYSQTARLKETESRQKQELLAAEMAREWEAQQKQEVENALMDARSLESLSRLAGGIVHDFNNVLTVIMGNAEVALYSADSAARANSLHEILRAGASANELTRSLLNLGRRSSQVYKPLPLARELGRLVDTMRRILPNDIEIVLGIHDESNIWTEPVMFERTFYNLMLNARDALPKGGRISITANLESAAAENRLPDEQGEHAGMMCIRIVDNGIGMDADTLSHLFEPFFTTKASGHGLGLSMIKAWLTSSGGDIRVESTLGVGTSIQLYFPACKATEEPASERNDTAKVSDYWAARQILVVDDGVDLQGGLAAMLHKAGFDTLRARSFHEACALLETRHDLVLLCFDGLLPGQETHGLLQRVTEHWPHLRVLLCSGHEEAELARRGIDSTSVPVLAKPCSTADLVTAINKLLATLVPMPLHEQGTRKAIRPG